MKKLSAIIVSYNNLNILKQCLDSLYTYNDINDALEIIVSDNSPDKTLFEYVCKNYDNVKIIHNSKNGGFGYGNNRGFEISTGEYLLFLNPDTYLIEPIFQYAISKFENDDDLAAFGLNLVKPNMENNFSYGLLDGNGIVDWIKILIYWKTRIFKEGKMYTSGADLFIRRDIFEKIGCFDENIFMYYEESDICHRIKALKAEFKILFFPEKKIVHLEGATLNCDQENAVNSYKNMVESYEYYCKKHKLPFKSNLRRDILLFKIRLMKYRITNKKDRIQIEKRIISIAVNKLTQG